MSKRVAMIAQQGTTSRFLTAHLQELVGDAATVDGHCFEQGLGRLDADIAIVTTAEVSTRLGPWLSADLPLVTLKRTITRESWERVMALPPRTQVLVVNDTDETAWDTVALLHELGAAHLKLTPYWPGVPDVPEAAVAVTPGEAQLVPPWMSQVVDLGPRVIDPSTVVDLLTLLDRYDGEAHRRLLAYSDTVMARPGLKHTLSWFTRARAQLEAVMDEMQEGVVAYDSSGTVSLVNRRAEVLLGREGWRLVGRALRDLAGEMGLSQAALGQAARAPKVLEMGGRQMVLRRRALDGEDGEMGGILLLRDVTEIQDLERRLRQELTLRGHITRYSFADIVGPSEVLRATVRKAQKLAPGGGNVLILGASGTGKELFAQAMHAASPRARYPFVAVSCAAVPETLLESELFGYEEGAFTGARRGGKEGLFEQAHMGTIFLDEIGDLSPALQGRLLRVLQEREVLRVGGTRLRPIDVRVFSATHKNLDALVRQGKFRADLYHRLDVLMLRVPLLVDRREDIPDLIRYFLAARNDHRPVPEAVMAALMQYDWPGNVRELRNCVEYMVQVADGPFTVADLPDPVLSARAGAGGAAAPAEAPAAAMPGAPAEAPVAAIPAAPAEAPAAAIKGAPVLLREAADRELRFLLGALDPTPLGPRLGRRALARAAAAAGLALTEAQIRRRFQRLAAGGLVAMQPSGPPVLTPAGEATLRRL